MQRKLKGMSVATELAPLRLTEDDGVPVSLGEFWAERPVVLLFVRHFGCVFCREQVNLLKKYIPEIRARGAEMVIVGSGDEASAAAFREDLALDVPILVDPDLVSYRTAGLRRDLRAALSPKRVRNAWRAFKDGYRQRPVQGDPWQQGGVFVIAAGGEDILFAHVSDVPGDHPDPLAVLEAVPRRRQYDDEQHQAAE